MNSKNIPLPCGSPWKKARSLCTQPDWGLLLLSLHKFIYFLVHWFLSFWTFAWYLYWLGECWKKWLKNTVKWFFGLTWSGNVYSVLINTRWCQPDYCAAFSKTLGAEKNLHKQSKMSQGSERLFLHKYPPVRFGPWRLGAQWLWVLGTHVSSSRASSREVTVVSLCTNAVCVPSQPGSAGSDVSVPWLLIPIPHFSSWLFFLLRCILPFLPSSPPILS